MPGTVLDASPAAMALGVQRGQPLGTAHRLAPEALFLDPDPAAETAALEAALERLAAFSPGIAGETNPTDPAFGRIEVQLDGLERLWGPEPELVERLREALAPILPGTPRAGIAGTRFAALVAAGTGFAPPFAAAAAPWAASPPLAPDIGDANGKREHAVVSRQVSAPAIRPVRGGAKGRGTLAYDPPERYLAQSAGSWPAGPAGTAPFTTPGGDKRQDRPDSHHLPPPMVRPARGGARTVNGTTPGGIWRETPRASRLPLASVPPGGEADFLAPLPAALLSGDSEVRARLARFGLGRIGQVAAIPRSALVARFGAEGELLHARARGEETDPFRPRRASERMSLALPVEPAVDDLEPLRFLLHRLVAALADQLLARGLATATVRLRLALDVTFAARGTSPQVDIEQRLPEPTAEAEAIERLLVARLERTPPTAPVARLELELAEVAPAAGQQLALFVPQAARSARLGWQLVRLALTFGEDRIRWAEIGDPEAPLPETRWRWVMPGVGSSATIVSSAGVGSSATIVSSARVGSSATIVSSARVGSSATAVTIASPPGREAAR
jgi:nucleotidyltransferase/DNA polymerase involved in DNA repair